MTHERTLWSNRLRPVGIGALSLALLGALAALSSGSPADDEKSPVAGKKIDGWGKLGSLVRGTDGFYQLTYYYKTGTGRTKNEKILVQIPETLKVYADRAVRVDDLKPEQEVYVLARRVERDVPRRGGGGLGGRTEGKDYQFQNARVVLVGEKLSVNESFTDAKTPDVKWYKATVTMATGGLTVRYDGHEYRVTLERGAPILLRIEVDRKLLKSGQYYHVAGDKTEAPPEATKKSSKETAAFQMARVVLLDRRYLTTAYAAVFK